MISFYKIPFDPSQGLIDPDLAWIYVDSQESLILPHALLERVITKYQDLVLLLSGSLF